MVSVKGGSFVMGNESNEDDDAKAHPVLVSDFQIGTYPVTIAEYLAFAEDVNAHYPYFLP